MMPENFQTSSWWSDTSENAPKKPAVERIAPTVVVGDDLKDCSPGAGVTIVKFSIWTKNLAEVGLPDRPKALACVDGEVLGFLLTEASLQKMGDDDPVRALIEDIAAPVICCPKADSADKLRTRIIELLLQSNTKLATENALERAANAEIRRQHMDMQSRFSQFEEFAYHALAPKYMRMQEWQETESKVTIGGDVRELKQALPFSSNALAAVDVYVSTVTGSGGKLSLTLTRQVGPAFAEPISVDITGKSAGHWVRFHLNIALAGPPEDAVAVITYEGDGSVALALSHPSPVEEFRVRADGVAQIAPLAMHGFRGMPGAELPETQSPRTAPPMDGKARLISAFDIKPARLLPQLHRLVPSRKTKDYIVCEYWDGENGFLVHPSVYRPVVAVIRGIAASRLTRLIASIQVARRDTESIDFAIGAAPARSVQNSKQALATIGPWQTLQPGEWGVCEANISHPIAGKFDIFMATSMVGRKLNRHGWALFRDFQATNASGDT